MNSYIVFDINVSQYTKNNINTSHVTNISFVLQSFAPSAYVLIL